MTYTPLAKSAAKSNARKKSTEVMDCPDFVVSTPHLQSAFTRRNSGKFTVRSAIESGADNSSRSTTPKNSQTSVPSAEHVRRGTGNMPSPRPLKLTDVSGELNIKPSPDLKKADVEDGCKHSSCKSMKSTNMKANNQASMHQSPADCETVIRLLKVEDDNESTSGLSDSSASSPSPRCERTSFTLTSIGSNIEYEAVADRWLSERAMAALITGTGSPDTFEDAPVIRATNGISDARTPRQLPPIQIVSASSTGHSLDLVPSVPSAPRKFEKRPRRHGGKADAGCSEKQESPYNSERQISTALNARKELLCNAGMDIGKEPSEACVEPITPRSYRHRLRNAMGWMGRVFVKADRAASSLPSGSTEIAPRSQDDPVCLTSGGVVDKQWTGHWRSLKS